MAESEASEGARAVLVISDGGFDGMRYVLARGETIIGRNPTTEVTLLDESNSREHAIISYDEATQTYTVEDLQSTNSTKVNGKRIRSQRLAHGDDLHVGKTHFRFLTHED